MSITFCDAVHDVIYPSPLEVLTSDGNPPWVDIVGIELPSGLT